MQLGRWTGALLVVTLGAAMLGACGSASSSGTTTTTTHVASGSTSTTSTPATTSTSTTTTTVTSTSVASVPTATFGSWTGIKPTTIYFSGDGGNIVTGISWSSWNSQGAIGNGTWGDESCVPSCAQGTVTPTPTAILLSNPVGDRFTRVTEVQSGPGGQTLTFTIPNRAYSAS